MHRKHLSQAQSTVRQALLAFDLSARIA
ncbi:MAG: hypothetical protein RJA30_9, partial [Actinomycetota bacterium]